MSRPPEAPVFVSLHDAATLLQVSPRTLRARLARGDLPGKKHNGAWLIDRDHLPMTETQRHTLRERADDVRGVVERAIARRQPSHTVEDNEPFRIGRALLPALAGRPEALVLLHGALRALVRAHHEFDRGPKVTELRAARSQSADAVALLLLDTDEATRGVGRQVEDELLPRIGGLIRWAEGLK